MAKNLFVIKNQFQLNLAIKKITKKFSLQLLCDAKAKEKS